MDGLDGGFGGDVCLTPPRLFSLVSHNNTSIYLDLVKHVSIPIIIASRHSVDI